MKQKKNPRFRFSGSIDMEIIRRQVKRHRRSVLGQWTIRIVVAAMIVTGTYLVIENQTYTSVATADSHKKDTEDSNQYIAFSDGVIRYSRDGVVFLNKKNKEKWIQPCQIQNPIVDVNEDVFAIADVGGNTIMIFQKSGLKGEIETTLPIEKISVSNQGIVSAILKNESTPQIISYDAVREYTRRASGKSKQYRISNLTGHVGGWGEPDGIVSFHKKRNIEVHGCFL